MFQDSDREYTGAGTGVAGAKPAAPVSLSAAQQATARAVVADAFQKLTSAQWRGDAATAQVQLYEVAQEILRSSEQGLSPDVLIETWRKNQDRMQTEKPMVSSAVVAESPAKVETGTPTPSNMEGENSPVQSAPQSFARSTQPTVPEGQQIADGVNSEDESAGQSESTTTPSTQEGGMTADENAQSVTDTTNAPGEASNPAAEAGQTEAPQATGQDATPGVNDARVDVGSSERGNAAGPQGSEKEPEKSVGQAGQNESAVDSKEGSAGGVVELPNQPGNKENSDRVQSTEGLGNAQNVQPQGTPAPAGTQGQTPESGSGGLKAPEAQPEKQGLPTGNRERFKRGLEDRKSGQSFKDAYSARKLPPGGSAVKGLGQEAVKGAAKNVAQEGAKDVAQTAAKAVVKEAVKDTAKVAGKVASKSNPVTGLLTDIDLKGTLKAAKDLKNLKVLSAAKGIAQSAAVTLFRVSYDPWAIGFTFGLSLIATLVVGSFLFFMPNSSMTFLERLLVVALWILLIFIVLLILGLILISLCNGPTGWGIWAASWFSKAAADINKFCEPIGAIQGATKALGR